MPRLTRKGHAVAMLDARRTLNKARSMLELTGGTKEGAHWSRVALACRQVLSTYKPRVH